jgi:hypothetical protein
MPSGRCTHSQFFPRGRMRWVNKTIYSRHERALLSVDSCIEVVKGLYRMASPRRHGETCRRKVTSGPMCVGPRGGVIGITKAALAVRFKRVRLVGVVSRVRLARLIVDS